MSKNTTPEEYREPEPRTFRITVQKIAEFEGINARDAVDKARRRFNPAMEIVRVEELVPQPPLTVDVKDGEWH